MGLINEIVNTKYQVWLIVSYSIFFPTLLQFFGHLFFFFFDKFYEISDRVIAERKKTWEVKET